MEKIDIIFWILGVGFSFIFGLMVVMWNSLSKRVEGVESSLSKRIEGVESSLSKRIEGVESSLSKRIEGVESSLSKKIDKLDEKVTDIDRRLCRLEGAFSSKECCMLIEERHVKKAE